MMSPDSRVGWLLSKHGFEYFIYGKNCLLLEWPPRSDKEILSIIRSFEHQLALLNVQGINDIVPAYHSIAIHFNSSIIDHQDIIGSIESFDFKSLDDRSDNRIIEINVSYNLSHGLDLVEISQMLDLSIEEIITVHSSTIYDVHFIVFLPGFLYLSGLDERLALPRKSTPRVRVPAGSVAFANGQTGIYPSDSPGGWNIIGKADITLFNPDKDPPCPILPGQKVKFVRQYD